MSCRGFSTKRQKRTVMAEDVALQITSMADVFMILLVFLLKSYSTSVSNIDPPQGMLLPNANNAGKIQEALKVEISDSAIRLDGQPIANLRNFQFRPQDMSAQGSHMPLQQGFTKKQTQKSVNARGSLLVLADQRTPYSTLKTVLNTAAVTGWREFKLVVVEDQ